MNDNTTPLAATEYDKQINKTIPYYSEFYTQTLSLIKTMGLEAPTWLDLGCGTGTLEEYMLRVLPKIKFELADPSASMLEQAKEKLAGWNFTYNQAASEDIDYTEQFDVVTAIQAHHYLHEEERRRATENVLRALCPGGIYISFENVVAEDVDVRAMELQRWGNYQMQQGKTKEEAEAHMKRCNVNYFPITAKAHDSLLKELGFERVHVFWYSFMQMGIYGIKKQ